MMTGEVDLDRAIWDPEYRRKVLNFLSSEAANRRRPANDEGIDSASTSGRNGRKAASDSGRTGS